MKPNYHIMQEEAKAKREKEAEECKRFREMMKKREQEK